MSVPHLNQQNIQPDVEGAQQSTPVESTSTTQVPIEVKWNIPAWMMRDPGPKVLVEDDDLVD